MKRTIRRGSLLLASTLLVFACGRNETVASKSAAAYREAQAKGTPVAGGHEHGGHDVATATGGTAAVDHSAHGTAVDPHAGHDMTAGGTADHGAHGARSAAGHAAMGHGAGSGHGTARGAAMDHSAHGTGTTAGHEGHGTTTGSAAHDQHAGMQHGTPGAAADPHAQHRQPAAAAAHAGHDAVPAAGAPRVVPGARVQPAATLQPDEFDAPAPIAVAEARKAAGGGGGGHEGHGTPSTAEETVYTCPMHPEVTSATPGNCPKCGMALVKKEK